MTVSRQQGFERMRAHLWAMLDSGVLAGDPSLEESVRTALRCPDPSWLPQIFSLVRAQGLEFRRTEPEKKRPSFPEPPARRLGGELFVGHTLPSGHPVHLPLRAFGADSQFLIAGTSGTGKSTLLNFLATQLIPRAATTVYDTLDQCAPLLVPLHPPDQLRVVDFHDYRRNLFRGPPGMEQLDWIRISADHLMEALKISDIAVDVLVEVAEQIRSAGRVVTLPALYERVRTMKDQSANALARRLSRLRRFGDVFTATRGFDLDELLGKSLIFNLKGASETVRRLIYFDHFAYFTQRWRSLQQWRLRHVFVFHEARALTSRGAQGENPVGESYFLKMIAEARNHGIGFALADQVPHLAHATVKSNLGTRAIFRLEDGAAVDDLRQALRLSPEQRHELMNLPNQQLVLRRVKLEPFLVKIPALY